jgi:hypothetical protein
MIAAYEATRTRRFPSKMGSDQKTFLKEFDTAIEDAPKPNANANSEPKALVGESKMWETGSTKNSGQSVQRLEGSQKPPTVGDHRGLKKTR